MSKDKMDPDSLHSAILNNDFEKVQRLIKKGADVNAPNEKGLTPVHIAVKNNNLEILKLLFGLENNEYLKDVEYKEDDEVEDEECKEDDEVEDEECKEDDEVKAAVAEIDMKAWIYALMLDNRKAAIIFRSISRKSLYLTNNQGETILHYCVKYKSINFFENLEFLLSSNVLDINQVDLEGYSPLHLAVINNDVRIVQRLLKLGANVYAKTTDGRSPIHFAVKHQCYDTLRLLIGKSIDVNDPVSSTGTTALHIAVENNDISSVNILIGSGGDLHCTDNEGKNLLHVAVLNKHEEMLKFLLEKKVNVNERFGKTQRSVLELALLTDTDHTTVKVILNYNPDLNSTNKNGLSAIFVAVESDGISRSADKIFRLKPDLDIITNTGSSLLHYAVKYQNINIIHFLLENNIKVYNVDKNGYNALHYAVKYCDARIVTLLVNKNFDVNAKTKYGYTALHVSLLNKFHKIADIIKILLNSGANVNVENSFNKTPLFYVKRAYEKVLKLLLDAGADVNHFDKKGNGFMCFGNFFELMALMRNETNILLSLIEHKINFNKINSNNDTIFHLMAKKNILLFEKSYDLLLKNGVNINGVNSSNQTPLNVCLENGAHTLLFTYFSKGAIANKNKEGETLLHLVIKKQQRKIAFFLLKNGTNLSDVTVNGDTVLHYAVEYSTESEKKKDEDSILELLLKFDVNNMANAKNNDGKTPLHLAVSKNSLQMVETLFSKNIDVNIKDKEENSPLCYAIANKNLSMTKLLLKKGACIEGKHRGRSIYDLAELSGDKHIYQMILLF